MKNYYSGRGNKIKNWECIYRVIHYEKYSLICEFINSLFEEVF